MPVMCLPLPPARPVSTDMFSDCERVRFTSREAMEVYVSTRAEVFAAACGSASARHMAKVATDSIEADARGGFTVDLRAVDMQLYALACTARAVG